MRLTDPIPVTINAAPPNLSNWVANTVLLLLLLLIVGGFFVGMFSWMFVSEFDEVVRKTGDETGVKAKVGRNIVVFWVISIVATITLSILWYNGNWETYRRMTGRG